MCVMSSPLGAATRRYLLPAAGSSTPHAQAISRESDTRARDELVVGDSCHVATTGAAGSEPARGTGQRAEIAERVKRALYAMSNGTCYAPDCMQPAFMDTGPGGIRINVEVAHVYGVKPKAPRFRPDLTDDERDDWRHLLLLCDAHHRAIDDASTGEKNYPAEELLRWKELKERGRVNFPSHNWTQDALERLLAQYFEDPSVRLGKLVDRLDGITKDAERTGRLTSDNVQELRMVVGMLQDTETYRLADAAGSLMESADIYSSINLGTAARSLAEAAEILSNLDLESRATELHSAAEQLSYSTRRLPEY